MTIKCLKTGVVAVTFAVACSSQPTTASEMRSGSEQSNAIAVPLLQHPGGDRDVGDDLLDKRIAALAGANARNCGVVQVHGDPKAATKCVQAAWKSGAAFHVRYGLYGFESPVAQALVRSYDGNAVTLVYFGNVSGVGPPRSNEVVNMYPCPKPLAIWVNPRGRPNCFKQLPEKPMTTYDTMILERY